MQRGLRNLHPDLPISLLTVNAVGYASGIPAMANVGDLPLLQDHPEVDAWGHWQVTFRDVVILGRNNERLDAYNLTEHDLADADSYAELEQLLIDAAEASSP